MPDERGRRRFLRDIPKAAGVTAILSFGTARPTGDPETETGAEQDLKEAAKDWRALRRSLEERGLSEGDRVPQEIEWLYDAQEDYRKEINPNHYMIDEFRSGKRLRPEDIRNTTPRSGEGLKSLGEIHAIASPGSNIPAFEHTVEGLDCDDCAIAACSSQIRSFREDDWNQDDYMASIVFGVFDGGSHVMAESVSENIALVSECLEDSTYTGVIGYQGDPRETYEGIEPLFRLDMSGDEPPRLAGDYTDFAQRAFS